MSVTDDETGTLPGQGGTGGVDRVPIVGAYHQNKSGTVTPREDAAALRSGASHSYQGISDGVRFRRLTPRECERLQGWQDGWTAFGLYLSADLPKSRRSRYGYTVQPVSDTQRYRMTGNGVTADVVREIVKKMVAVGRLD